MPEVSIRDAADALGVSMDTVRRRIKDGTLDARKVPMGKGYRYMVQLDEAEAPGLADAQGDRGASGADADEVIELRARVTELEATNQGLERLVGSLEADRAAWQKQASAWQEQAKAMQVLAETAQRRALPEPVRAETDEASTDAGAGEADDHGDQGRETSGPDPPASWWQRFRTWWLGQG